MDVNLTKRLNAVMQGGNLTVSDLARWLGRPFPTVRGWVRGRDARAAEGDMEIVIERLKVIEKRIRLKKGLPVPQFVAQRKIRPPTLRIAYLNRLMARKKM